MAAWHRIDDFPSTGFRVNHNTAPHRRHAGKAHSLPSACRGYTVHIREVAGSSALPVESVRENAQAQEPKVKDLGLRKLRNPRSLTHVYSLLVGEEGLEPATSRM